MKKRIISLFLAFVTLLGILPVTSLAAPTLEEAMAEVNVYAKNETLNWLTMNGSVKEQHYTYYKYESVQTGQVKEIPAYCVDPKLYGVPVKVPEGTPIKYSAKETMSDYKLVGIVSNGYPHQSLETLGLKSVNEGYYATKTAVWIHILGNWSIDKLGINPNLSGADREAAERVLKATKDIYWRGVMWNKMYTPKLTATADRDKAYPVTINGEAYYQQEFTVRSETWAIESVKLSLGEGAPAGAKILDKDNKEITSLVLDTNSDDGFYNTCKVVYPASSIEGQSGSVQLNMSCVVDQYVVYYAKTLEQDKYGNIQDYLLDTDPSYPIEASAISQYSADPDKPEPDPDPDPGITQLKITKLETGTNTPLEGAVFEVLYPDGKPVGSFSTNANGIITIPLSITGNFTVTEKTPPKFHVLPKHTTQNVTVMHGKTAELTFWNDPYGSLRVHKVSDTGDNLAGVTIQIKHIQSGETWTEKTNQSGVAVFNELPLGGYEVREMAGIEGWIAETDTVQTVNVVAGEESTATIVNKALPGIKIIKYDRTTLKIMADIPFEIWRDGVSLGQYTTNAQGEILITNAQPGTYLVREVQSDDEHVTDTTPQQVELKPGDGIKELVFYNGKKPGIRLVKVDSANLSKPLPNVKFSIRAVDGTFGPKEFTTDQNGEIDLSKLSPGAYEVTELECPGYVIDQAQRIIQLEADQMAEFVFTNSKKPDLLLKKVSSDGKPLAGVSFRLAKIEDGSRYLDRTTNAQGEILWEGLEPGVYSLRETATTADHILDLREYHVELFPGKVSTICIENQKRPSLTVWKRDADTGEVVPNTVFLVKAADGHSVNEVRTGPDGKGTLENLLPGVYEISEKSVPEPYLQDAANQLVTLYPNKNREVLFENHKRPSIEIIKENSITHERQSHVPFQVWYASNNTSTGEYNDLGVFYTDENGRIVLTEPDIFLRDGWFRVKELEAPHGFALADPDTQEAFIPSGTSHTFLFQDRPLSAICVWKYDSVSPNMAIEGAVFQIRYLSGNTSGTGGTVIGTYRTGQNGSFTATGLPAGTYVIEELSSDGDHVIDTPPQTVYLSGDDQEVIQVHFGNSPKGNLLVKKVDSITKQPLSDVEFLVTDSKGNVVGDANGKFVTDSTGSFTVSGIDPSTTLIVKEIRAKDGYILDDVPQTVTINAGQTVTLEFRNQPMGSLLIRKVCSVNPSVTLANAEFKVAYSDGTLVGNSNGVYRSDENGEVRIEGLIPGKSVVVTETKAPAGFLIDAQSQTIVVQAGKTVTITMKNQPRGKLIIQKRDSLTNQVLPGAQFRITTAAGCEVGLDGVIGTATLTSNSIFTTDSQGEIRISNLAPGAYVISEIKAPDNYVMDNPSTNVVIGPNGDTQTVIVTNTPKATLTILKRDAVTKKPLANAEFIVRDSEGHAVGPTNGIYKTGTDGTVVVSGLKPGATIMVSECKAPSGYILDETPKHIVVKSGISNSLIFDDEPGTTLILQKFIEGTANEPLAGVAFKVVDGSGAAVGPDDGVYYTDHAGEIVLSGIEPGTTVKAREIKTVDGFVLDGTPQDILIKGGEVQRLTFWNKRAGTLVLQKKDSVSGSFISGAQFQLTYANGGFVDNDNGHLSSNGLYTTDERGEIRISGITGTVVAKEVKAAPGYVIDQSTQTQTVTGLIPNSTVVVVETRVPSNYVLDPTPRTIIVRNGSNSVASGGAGNGGNISGGNNGNTGGSGNNDVTVENLPKTTLAIEKYLETDTGEQPLKGVTFLVTDSSGAVIGSSNGEFTSDENGRVVIPNLEPGITVTAKEIKVPNGVVLDPTPKSIKIEGGIGGQTLRFVNQRAGNLIINKVDGIDKHPLSGVTFKITYADGSNVDQDGGKTSSNGIYTTDANGQIKISNVVGAVKIMEIETIPGYYIDEKYRTQTVEIKPNDTQTITVYNVPTQALVIQKFVTGSKDQPLAGVEFLVTDSDGTVLGPNNGIYKTDQFGRITIKDLTPGTVITAREIKTLDGFVLDSTPQSIEIKSGEVQTMTFYNAPIGGLELIKVSEADKTQRIKGVTFEIRKMDGALIDTVTTGDNGRVHVSLDAGDYYCVEVEAAEGFKLDSTPHYFTIRDNETTTLTVTNAPFSGILIHKVDSATKEGIYGVTFLLYDANKNPIGQYTSDDKGYVYIDDLPASGRYFLRELENEGYVVDTQLKTVYITPGTTTEITWENTAITGQIQIFKTSADYNSMNGWPAGTPIPGTEFEIYHYRTGNLVDTVRTDKNGVAVSKPLPLGRYKVVESKAADFYGLDKTPIEVEIEHAGQIVKAAMTNKALYTNVSIKKTGFVEVMPGQQLRYDFSGIANNSTTALTSFYWRDTLPTQAVRLDKIVTGTYNVQGNYKIVFKTNLNGEYRTMYDNLSSMQNYVLDASPAALGLASNEYVTEFMVSFGIVPGSFRQVEAPRVYCNVVSWLTGGTQFVNQADVGGVYNGQWIMATSRWVTRVYKPTAPLPRTGY